MADCLFLIQCLSVSKRRQIKLNAPDLGTAMERARQYFVAKHKEYAVVKLLARSSSSHVHVKLTDFVMQGISQHHNCNSADEANALQKQVLDEIRSRGMDLHFDAWLFGNSVHVFPVYHEMPGSLNYIDRTRKKEYGHGRFNNNSLEG